MMSAHSKMDYTHRRHGLVVKKDKQGNILLGNGSSIAVFEQRIKSYKPIAELAFINAVKCIEFNGDHAPGADSQVITTMIKSLVFQYGSTIEQVHFCKIDIDMEGMSQIISACANLKTLIFYRAGVKYIIQHRIQHHFWVEVKRNHRISTIRFIECDSISTSNFVEAVYASKHPETHLNIEMVDPTSAMELTYITQFEKFAKEIYRPREGLSIVVDLAVWGLQLQAKADAIEIKPNDKEHIKKRRKAFKDAVHRARTKLQKSVDRGTASSTLFGVTQALVIHRHSPLFLKCILKQRPELFLPPMELRPSEAVNRSNKRSNIDDEPPSGSTKKIKGE